MRKLLLAVSMLLASSSAFAIAVETPFLVCQTEDRRSWVQLSLFKEKNQYEIQVSALTSSPVTANIQYWSVGKIIAHNALQIKTTFTSTGIVKKNLPMAVNAYTQTRATSYYLTTSADGEVIAIVSGYYGETLKNYLQFVNCVLPKK